MWIKQTKDGKYRLCDRYKAIDGSLREVSVTMSNLSPKSKKAATEALRARAAKLERDFTSFRFSDLVEFYIKSQKNEVKASTLDRNSRVLRNMVSVIGDIPAEKLTAGFIKAQIMKEWPNPTTANEKMKRIKAMLHWCYLNDFIRDREVYDKLQYLKEPTEKEKVQDKYLDSSELAAVLDDMDIEKWRLITEFLVLSGLRIGELVALEDKDVDFKHKEIRVTKTFVKNLGITDSPKTLESNRTISMQNELLNTARELHRLMQHIRLMSGSRLNLFVLSDDGSRMNQDSYNKYLKEKTEKVIGRPLTAHALRHSHVALMAAKGIPIEVLTRRLGHSNSRITKDVYMHVTSDLKAADAALIREISIL